MYVNHPGISLLCGLLIGRNTAILAAKNTASIDPQGFCSATGSMKGLYLFGIISPNPGQIGKTIQVNSTGDITFFMKIISLIKFPAAAGRCL